MTPSSSGRLAVNSYNGAPVGMTRIFHYEGAPEVPPQYFSDAHYMSKTVS
jgi:hypothetical protein